MSMPLFSSFYLTVREFAKSVKGRKEIKRFNKKLGKLAKTFFYHIGSTLLTWSRLRRTSYKSWSFLVRREIFSSFLLYFVKRCRVDIPDRLFSIVNLI